MTLPELLNTFRRRAVEAASINATAPVASIYEAVVGELAPLCANGTARAAPPTPSRLLTARDAATLLGVKVRWLYRHADTLPFARRLSDRVLRFEESGLMGWLGRRR